MGTASDASARARAAADPLTQAGADAGDDDPAEGHDRERPHEAVLEVAPPQPREHDELERNDDDRGDDGGVVVRDQEGKRVQDPSDERSAARDRPADDRVSPAGELAR